MKPKVSQSEEVGDGGCEGESRCQEYELWELAETAVALVRGRNDCNYSIWKEMLEEHHYLHAAKLYGQQIKYLVRSSEIGWIGAMSFSSSAWRVRVRDERLGWDEDAYKVTPVLVETYVEKGRYEGTCYKASNWEYLGETQGRGRNDRYHKNRLSRKHVFAYELEEGIQVIAMLGGFIKGKGREPGVEVMWLGMRRLADILTGVSLAMNVHQFLMP